ncbi:hypothetical protein [Paraburkholderia terricola]|uniref:Uncharacterized protein n=1 Tax=Paraburkholderia terricola TaxID=169427 RepID=A0ABU1LTN7_9BURK|nr:hypothetical protein [Paraburkholderia terricola]MDR6410095.1 hypothetical protein [Paraburkholderia terricola]MDR6481255.1 hypothetical protein [Paraburkholderia terricola]
MEMAVSVRLGSKIIQSDTGNQPLWWANARDFHRQRDRCAQHYRLRTTVSNVTRYDFTWRAQTSQTIALLLRVRGGPVSFPHVTVNTSTKKSS